MWEMIRHNNYARLSDLLRVVTTLLTRMGAEPALHFSEFIRFLGTWISAASDSKRVPVKRERSLSLAVLIRDRPVKLPIRRVIARQLLFGEQGADHVDRDAVLLENRVVEGAVGHLAGI